MLRNLLFVLLGAFATQAYAQVVWRDIAESGLSQTYERRIVPQRYRLVQIDAAALQSVLELAPEGLASRGVAAQQPVLDLPMPDGNTMRFHLQESPVMAPGLQARYPGIRTYTGYSPDDPTAQLKCDWTPWGFHAMLWTASRGTIFIDPYSHGATDAYVVYNKRDYVPPANKGVFQCDVETAEPEPGAQEIPPTKATSRSNDGNMRQYRLAIACTGEYASFHGGTVPLVMAAMVTSINRVNSVYEREFAVTLQIVNGNDTLIFLDAATDPYTNNNGNTMLNQNRNTCNARIGAANYDIGHVFSTGGGGIAGLGVVCTSGKARGVTGLSAPIGDAFDIDYVCHEMGHQFSGNHSFNNACSGNINPGTACETGSGSTIMGYAGVCAPNVQDHSDPYFHAISVEEIVRFITQDEGSTCPVLIPTGNTAAPTVDAGQTYVIPKSTPFVLTATGADPDSADVLTYCWEQMDKESATQPPLTTSTVGPSFRSYNPDTLPSRYFPGLKTLATNASTTWEKLPSVGRQMNFRVTVRDNNPTGGRTAQDDVSITVNKDSGPFRVTYPNSLTKWFSGELQTVTWDVANTDKAPVSCQTVNIRLSTDGGLTYPVVLAAGVPNNGRYCLQVPDVETLKGRVMVEAADNIFFDISNNTLLIGPPAEPAFSLCLGEQAARVCLPQTFSTSISTAALLGSDSLITFSVDGLPAGATASFSANPVLPGESSQLDITLPEDLAKGVLNVIVLAAAGGDTVANAIALTLISSNFDGLALLTPVNGASGQDQSPVLHWQKTANADAYDLELATFPTFDPDSVLVYRENITADSLKMPVLLDKGKVFYWRVRPKNECGAGKWIGPFAFATFLNFCTASESADIPKNITGSLAVTVESKITILGSATISDVNISRIQGNHEFFKDLEMHLISPKGTDVLLFKDKCGGYNGNFNFGFDDNAPNALACPPSNTGTRFQPAEPFSIFNGEDAAGDWILRVKDNVISSGGAITAFDLEICSSPVLSPPVLVNNNVLQLAPGTNAGITVDLLKAEDADNTDDELVYTLMTLPEHGQLQLFWTGALALGAQFTQADLNNEGLRYFSNGDNANSDQFCFTITDGAGGLVQDCFHIQPFPLSAGEATQGPGFLLAPNPAAETVRIAFNEILRSDTRIRMFDTSGRLVHSATLSAGEVAATLQLSRLPGGMYTIAVDNAEGGSVRKLVVRR